ncbi:MAG: ABC transporter ATP-binding protein [Pseudomonadota bacterium]
MVTISTNDLSLTIGTKKILENVRVEVGSSELIALVGPNGAGKSTLLKAMAGLIPEASDPVQINGARLRSHTAAERARLVSYLPQDYQLAWKIPVESVVSLGRFAYGGSAYNMSAEDKEATQQALDTVGISHLATQRADLLSGGEAARMHFARFINTDTDILLTDEPCASLDLAHQHQILALLRGLAEAGKCVVISLHDLDLTWKYCPRTIIMHQGQLVLDGPTAEVLSPNNIAQYFGVSATVYDDGIVFNPTI